MQIFHMKVPYKKENFFHRELISDRTEKTSGKINYILSQIQTGHKMPLQGMFPTTSWFIHAYYAVVVRM